MVSPLLHHRLANLADLVTGIAVLGAGSSHSTHQLRIVCLLYTSDAADE